MEEGTYSVATELDVINGIDHVALEIVFPTKDILTKESMAKLHDMWFDIMAEIQNEVDKLEGF